MTDSSGVERAQDRSPANSFPVAEEVASRPWRIATAPVNWNNADVPGLRVHVPYRTMLAQMRRAGYDATEFGPGLPADPSAVREALQQESMTLVSAFCALPFRDAAATATRLAETLTTARMLRDLGSDLVLLSDAITPERSAYAGRVFDRADAPRVLPEERAGFLTRVEGVARILREELGLRVAFHPHTASYVEAPDEVRWLLDGTDPDLVGLCLDTGHIAYGGGDPVAFAREYGERIRHVHLKDVDRPRLDDLRAAGSTFEEGLAAYVFPTLGTGDVAFPAVLDALQEAGYRGYLVVEQDTQPIAPEEAALRNRRYLAETFGL